MLVPHIPAAAKAAIARMAFIFLFCGLDISAQPEDVTFCFGFHRLGVCELDVREHT